MKKHVSLRRMMIVSLLLLACAVLPGCVNAGWVGNDMLTRYQETVLCRSPQARQSDCGAGLLQPCEAIIPLDIQKKDGCDYVNLTLDQAIRLALLNSLDIRFVSYDPAISREQWVQAAAAFDAVVFGGYTHSIVEHQQAIIGASSNTRTDDWQFGIKQLTPLGTQWQLLWDFNRINDNSAFNLINPRYESNVALQLVQPLLRGYGVDFNLAQTRLARIGYKNSLAQFRQQVEQTVAQVQINYWTLAQNRRIWEIQKELLAETEKSRDRVIGRLKLDATQVEVKQTEAAVETRRATLIRAEKNVFDAQDQLARLLADKRINMLNSYQIVPATAAITTEVQTDRCDQLVKALKYNPQLEQARLAISAADVNVLVAQNGTLPVLNLKASVGLDGLDKQLGPAMGNMFEFNHIDSSIGAEYEYPLGNRAPEALLRQRRFERLKNITQLQNAADQVALNVNEIIRQIDTSYHEILAQRAAVEANRLQLTALQDQEEIRGQLNPPFLATKLQAQESLANALANEAIAVANYNDALAQLAQITGTSLMQNNIQVSTEAAIDYRPDVRYDTSVPPIKPGVAGDVAKLFGGYPSNFGTCTNPWPGIHNVPDCPPAGPAKLVPAPASGNAPATPAGAGAATGTASPSGGAVAAPDSNQ